MIDFRMSGLTDIIDILKNDNAFSSCVTKWEKIEQRNGEYSDFPDTLRPEIVKVLKKRGISKLYTHQAKACSEAAAGKNTVIVTPTASGKTLCYNLPVLNRLLTKKEVRALYIFPTKALSQDQQSELNEVVLGGELGVKVSTYDGDTPSSVRVSARDSGRIVITNPDMLHSGILPNHPKWIKFLSNLEYIVIDEIHIYRGVFGSHMTNLLRRLKRIARFYGGNPKFICCSATIGNPLELAQQIIEEEAVLIDNNGAPAGEKHVIMYNPPLVDSVQGIRRGVVLESQRLAVRVLKKGIKTIVFARSRVRTELIASYINKHLSNFYTDNHRIKVESYRGGYLPQERRSIEKGLREGTIQGVVSTNALELGIDIGGLDVSILAGFPGSISSSWQQAGRAGRRNTISVAIMIASAAPTDQYMIAHPEYFFSRSPESGWVNPDNLYIMMDHLKCAVFELPFKKGEEFGGPIDEMLGFLEEEGVIRFSEDTWYWADRSYPAEQISLRSASAENVVIVNTTKGKDEVIGEMDRPSAKELVFTNAVYIHRGDQYFVTNLDIENHRCYVEESSVNFYTDAVVKKDIKVLQQDRELTAAGVDIIAGDVLVRVQAAKYKKIKFATHENVGYGEISLPPEEMHTRSIILLLKENTAAGKSFNNIDDELKEHVISRIGTLMKNVAPFFLMCDPSDIGVAERLKDPHTKVPSLYFYDRYPGGTGLAEGFLDKLENILNGSLDLVINCPCESGCPSCIGPDDGEGEGGNRKKAVITFLERWLKEIV